MARRRLVLGLFFASGASALVYEICWSRLLGLQFGHTEQAAAVTLGAWFLGMALGSHLAARLAGRWRPLRLYAIAEGVAAGWALVTPALVGRLDDAAGLLHGGGAALGWRAAAATLVLLPATVALGATLPAITEHLLDGREAGAAGSSSALAYGVNTLGAVAGALLATYVLILPLGVRGSGWLAAAVSASCGIAAWALARRSSRPALVPPTPAPPIAGRWYAAAAVSGFATLGLEVLYLRLYGLVFHNSTYTFGAVLVVFLLALALGSLAVSSRRAARAAAELLPWSSITCALAAVGSVLAFAAATGFEYHRTAGGFASYLLGSLGLVALAVGPAALCLGTVLPLAWSAAGGGGSVVGRLAAVGTLAGAAGSLLTGFVLLPWLDLWQAFAALSAPYLALAAALWRGRWTKARAAGLALGGSALAAFSLTFARGAHGPSRPGETLLERAVSEHGWTDVVDAPRRGGLLLRQNLHHELGGSGYAWYLEREGHLALLLHPRPRRVLFLGLGTGITAGAATRHPEVESIEAVELAAPVIRAAARFAPWNHGIASGHPRARLVADDARHFLRQAGAGYDVIVSDLFVPWHSRTGYLYTVEHYRAARARLAPGGLFCQWLLTSELGAPELDLVADSFASVFPYATVWRADAEPRLPLLALVGSEAPLPIDAAALERRLAALQVPRSPGAPPFATAAQVLELYLGRWRVRHPGWLNTDDHPRVEFLAPIADADFRVLIGRRRVEYEQEVLARLPREGLLPGSPTPPLPAR